MRHDTPNRVVPTFYLCMKTNLPENISAALIDMDGVLYDSMPSHAKAWRQTTLEVGPDVDEKEFFTF